MNPQILTYLLLAALLCAIAIKDLRSGTIPNLLVLAGVALWLGSIFFVENPVAYLGDGLLGGLVVGGGSLAVSLLLDKLIGRSSPGHGSVPGRSLLGGGDNSSRSSSLGGGDVKLLFMTSLYLGLMGALVNLFLACVFGLVFSLVWSRTTRAKESSEASKTFPFGPAIALATILSLFGAIGAAGF